MGDLLLATNLVPRPHTQQGGAKGTPAWLNSSGTNAKINERDDWGNPVPGMFLDWGARVYAPLGEVTGTERTYLQITLKGLAVAFKGGTLTAGLTRTLGQPASSPAQITMGTGDTTQSLTGDMPVPTGDGPLYLVLGNDAASSIAVTGTRLSPAPITDDMGIFDGSEPDTETTRYEWTGEPELSASQAWGIGQAPDPDPDPDPDPEPEPEPEPTAWGQLVAAHINRAGDTETEQLASQHAVLVMEYVRGYTRGRGFTQHESGAESVTPGIRAVIIAATARLTANPEQVSYYQSGDYSERPAILAGWTLPELAVLNNYRKRWA